MRLGGMTDCFQPCEAVYRETYKAIQNLNRQGVHYLIVTKSSMVADDIYIRMLREYGLYDQIWQAAAILLPVKSVGVMGDERTYESTDVLRAVTSTDGMTVD